MAIEQTAAREVKPLLRGVSHQYGFFVVLGAVPVLIAFAVGPRATLAAVVYGLSLIAMLGVSAVYHRSRPSVRVEKWLERLDHSTIFVFIAGSYTPFCLLLPSSTGLLLLGIVWGGALLGMLRAMFWVDAPRWVSVPTYLLVGWAIVPFIGQVRDALGIGGLVLLGVGGILYSIGAIVFGLGRPNPWPKVFGFHEVFHAFVVVACVTHFVAVLWAIERLGAAAGA